MRRDDGKVDDGNFFFQAEDGIRDVAVTGVQTCALPISPSRPPARGRPGLAARQRPSVLVLAPPWGRGGVGRAQIGRASCRERVLISVVAGSLIATRVSCTRLQLYVLRAWVLCAVQRRRI